MRCRARLRYQTWLAGVSRSGAIIAASMSAQPAATDEGGLSARSSSRDSGAVIAPSAAAGHQAGSATGEGCSTSAVQARALSAHRGARIRRRSRAAGVMPGPPLAALAEDADAPDADPCFLGNGFDRDDPHVERIDV